MKCPKCKSLDVVETIYCNYDNWIARFDPEHIELQGYMCDKCDHEWSMKDK